MISEVIYESFRGILNLVSLYVASGIDVRFEPLSAISLAYFVSEFCPIQLLI